VLASEGARIVGRDLDDDEASVRGTIVSGLTADDIGQLDEFEGDASRMLRTDTPLLLTDIYKIGIRSRCRRSPTLPNPDTFAAC
jgi:hypothetical protein